MSGDETGELSPMAEAATAAHEMFLSLCQAGFSENQALFIIAQTMMGRAQ